MTFCLKETSDALITLVQTEQDCVKKLFKTVKTTGRISWVPDHWTDQQRQSPTAVPTCSVEPTARHDKLVLVNWYSASLMLYIH